MSRRRKPTAPTAESRHQPPTGETSRRTVIGICVVLVVMVLSVFGQTVWHEFIQFDDDEYVFENRAVIGGLSLDGVAWAFSHIHSSNWHPVTWLSHMLDCELYGLHPGGHHLTSVLIHAVNAVLLFLVLRRLTGAIWCSAFVAALFAIHPLRVESVAWVAERKDVLSGFFFMLTLGAYARYARKLESEKVKKCEGPVTPNLRFLTSGDYWLVVLFFTLGLMSKPMLVTLPFVLLLLDYWPLHRLGDLTQVSGLLASSDAPLRAAGGRLCRSAPFRFQVFIEKLPLLALSAASCMVTVFAQRGATAPIEGLPFFPRAVNAVVSYCVYLWQTVWPERLAVLYPWVQGGLSLRAGLFALVFLAGVSGAAFALRRRCGYLLTGWLWYLGMLVPVIGLMQVGIQTHADRYTYLPQIGLFIAIVWGAASVSARWRHRRVACASVATLVLAVLGVSTWKQTSLWRDGVTLWSHTLRITERNPLAHMNMGIETAARGRTDEAMEQFRRALEIAPRVVDVHNNLGVLLNSEGRTFEAVEHFEQALQIDPGYVNAHINLGAILADQGRTSEAVGHFERVLQIDPDNVESRNALGRSLTRAGEYAQAIEHYREVLRIDPDLAETHRSLAVALTAFGRYAEAMEHDRRALRIAPEDPWISSHLAWILATCPEATLRDGSEALNLALQAVGLPGGAEHPAILDTLAAAYAESGRFPEAVRTARQALDAAENATMTEFSESIRARLQLYELGLPFHEVAQRR